MNTKQVDYCIELAHTLNFSRAADNMFVSQPTFSYQIRLLEEEVGFLIFERSGRGAALTPAGEQFVSYLIHMREEMKRAIEQGQNFSAKYRDDISISLMVRQAVYFLPDAIKLFADTNPGVQVSPKFQYTGGLECFLKNEADILFSLEEDVRQIPGVSVHKLFTSKIYLIADKNDILANKNRITESDLYGRTLMVGGGSPAALKSVQQRLINSQKRNGDADAIYTLSRTRKMNKLEWLIDFVVQPGVVDMLDQLNEIVTYYLVEKTEKQYLVKVTKDFIITNEIADKVDAKGFVIGKYKFRRGYQII